jgi:N-acetylglutamate synthase-like GNAT family acetyltransferase
MSLLSSLDEKYPGGLAWLDGRLDDVEVQRAFADVAVFGDSMGAIAISTPKGKRGVKLSTFFVHPSLRDQHLGAHLLTRLVRRWSCTDVEQAIVTVDQTDKATAAFFERHAFAELPGRVCYGLERWDRVMRWTPNACATSLA